MPTYLYDERPRNFRLDQPTNVAHWEQPTNGSTVHQAMPYPLFVAAVYEALAFIEQTNETRERAARTAADAAGRVIRLGKRRRGGEGGGQAASP